MVDALLEREARTFARALGAEATPYVVEQYARAHAHLPLAADRADEALLRVARSGPVLARAADAWARVFAPRAALRRKLVTLAAVLESSAPGYHAFAPVVGAPVVQVSRLVASGVAFVALVALGVLVCGPVRLLARLRGVR